MRQRHIETFFAVMTYGTVTQAATRLGVTQPSVTTTLRQAEKEIGFALFDRLGGRLTPTTEARALYEEVVRAQASFSAIKSLCRQLRESETSQLRIAATQTLTEAVIGSAVEIFTIKKKGFDLAISTRSSNDILEAMDCRADEADLGFIFGEADNHGVYVVPIGECPLCIVAPSKWKLSGSYDSVLSKLKTRDFIGLNETEPVGRLGRSLVLKAGHSNEVRIRAQSHRLAGELAARGLGFGVLDLISATEIQATMGNAVHLIPVTGEETVKVNAVVPRADNLTRTTRRFISVFEREFKRYLTDRCGLTN